MINTNEYKTQEYLENAMHQLHRNQLIRLMRDKYEMIKFDVEQILLLIQHPFADKCAALDGQTIYRTADRIEELAKRLTYTCSLMKSACRLIPGEVKGEKRCK